MLMPLLLTPYSRHLLRRVLTLVGGVFLLFLISSGAVAAIWNGGDGDGYDAAVVDFTPVSANGTFTWTGAGDGTTWASAANWGEIGRAHV